MTDLLVNIDVDDIDRAVGFYTAALGLRVGRRFSADWVELLGGPAPIHLLGKPAGSPVAPSGGPQRDYGRHWTPIHLDFVVDDLEAALARAESAGARRETDVAAHAWGRIALFADPFGHGFCILSFTGRGYDEV